MINPLKDLQAYADEWYQHYLAQDFAWCEAQDPKHLADLVAALDLALTGHPRQAATRPWDEKHCAEVLLGDTYSVHLSDGGWSRVVLDFARFAGGAPIRLVRDVSLPKAIRNWDQLRQE
jgi:hypothetical protein